MHQIGVVGGLGRLRDGSERDHLVDKSSKSHKKIPVGDLQGWILAGEVSLADVTWKAGYKDSGLNGRWVDDWIDEGKGGELHRMLAEILKLEKAEVVLNPSVEGSIGEGVAVFKWLGIHWGG